MAREFTTSYVKDATAVFRRYKQLAERAVEQLPDEALITELDPESNSIAIIIKHMAGNMLSRWTDFLTSDGEKSTRDRDAEFQSPPKTRAQLMALWETGWQSVFSALSTLTDQDLNRTVTIRGEPHSVVQAINRQLTHYAYHTGQIVFLAKHLAGGSWHSLTIPRGKSKEFNAKLGSGKISRP